MSDDAGRLFRFVQFDVPGALGLEAGRYPVRTGERVESVLVVATLGTPVGLPKRRRRRRRRAMDVEADAEPLEVRLARATVIASEPFADPGEASAWLRRTTTDREVAERVASQALATLNRALHAWRVAAQDPFAGDVAPERAVAIRVGVGRGDELAEGEWSEAREMRGLFERRRRRIESLRPDETVADLLGGRRSAEPHETLLLRARADLDAGRERDGALELRGALEALFAAAARDQPGAEYSEELAGLRDRLPAVMTTAGEALRQELAPPRRDELADTLAIAERLVRRRRIAGD